MNPDEIFVGFDILGGGGDADVVGLNGVAEGVRVDIVGLNGVAIAALIRNQQVPRLLAGTVSMAETGARGQVHAGVRSLLITADSDRCSRFLFIMNFSNFSCFS